MIKTTCFILIATLIEIFIYNDESQILWRKDIKLTWEDFRQVPPSDIIDKNAMSGILVDYNYQVIEGKVPTFTLRTYFMKDSSWVVNKSDRTLHHEKLHFDMAELYTRKMRKDIQRLRQEGIQEIKPYIEIVHKYRDKNLDADELFDSQCFGITLNGQVIERANEHRQKKWIDSIAIELNRLKEYEYSE